MTKKTSPAYRASKEETIPINKLHPFSNHPFHMPSHRRCAAGRAAPAWASIWIVRALSNIAIGRRTCLFPQAVQPPIGMQQT